MRIDLISTRADRAGRYAVTFSDGKKMFLYPQTIQDLGIFQGMELSSDQMAKLKEAAGRMSAKMRSVRIVSASNVSKKDLEQRLIQKGEDPTHARQAVEWMEELDLLDDRKTAQQIVMSCISKGYGPARAKQALYEKRIPKEYWQEALENYPDQTDTLVSFLCSRLGEEPDRKAIQRAIDAAIRRGHSYSRIRAALSRLEADADEFPED